ncbi:hypothetical protein LSH36_1279g00020 [Paralvinella palmiformis]|uniref:START domain-containing protein n=1 Tax=Paralvinella palmiformis TaxID=53620 RepID=A0AAD9IUU7_9ANNE|nr:hypothetical protein LSH36_1279g00020 [Paralvinella palmiformis]
MVVDFVLLSFQVKGHFKDVSAATVYDVLHDPIYRKLWDNNMLESYEVCCLNPMNDIGYYAFIKCLMICGPHPHCYSGARLKSTEAIEESRLCDPEIMKLPPKKNFVRGISYITGYHVTLADNATRTDQTGCCVTYVTQSDPKGKLPVWVVNKASQIFAPKVMKKLHKATQNYEKWKAKNNPYWKPWIYPDQLDLPRINMDDVLSMSSLEAEEVVDETDIKEEDVKDDENGD